MIRLAAVGDVHCGTDMRSQIRAQFASVPDHADALLLAGDLTRLGLPEEAEVLANALGELRGMPIAGVLGNHDYQSDQQDEVRAIFEAAGVQMLEGSSVVWEIGAVRVAVAGSKGFGGGFEGTHGTAFGEPEMKRFVEHTRSLADRLDTCLRELEPADLSVLLLHYAPVRETLTGEPREIFPFLGSYLFAELADRHGVDPCAPRARPPRRGTRPDDRRDPRPERGPGGDPAGIRRLHPGSRRSWLGCQGRRGIGLARSVRVGPPPSGYLRSSHG